MLKRCDHRVDPQFSRKFLRSVVDADVVLTVAQVRVVRRPKRPAIVDHTDDGYIEWTVLTVHELVTLSSADRKCVALSAAEGA